MLKNMLKKLNPFLNGKVIQAKRAMWCQGSIESRSPLHQTLANCYIKGNGIEIGALHSPLEVPPEVTVRYLDRMTVEELRQQYPELERMDFVPVDIIEDGETLVSIPDESVDFVIARHTIEHYENPIGSLKSLLRVLRKDGILYLAVPDKRYTFDRDRPVTSLEHIIRDYTDGPEWSRYSHFEEYVRLVDKVPEQNLCGHVQSLMDMNYSIHFHVWTPTAFLELLFYCRQQLNFPLEIELFQRNDTEFIVIVKKTAKD